jgi:7-carboxy-7-deazaguanine synthase
LASEAAAGTAPRLKLTEIFLSLQGEARSAGLPTVFVRLTGCPLRCTYCDTAYAFYGGEWSDIEDIVAKVAAFGVPNVCVTGGEPLAQKRCILLLDALLSAGFSVSLETSGAIDISPVDIRVSRVVDIKTPDSGESGQNLWSNIAQLTPHDQLKFVICSRPDYEWAKAELATRRLNERCEVLFSPSYTQLTPRELADWIVADRLPVRFQMQLHKQLWGEEQER